MSAPLLSVRGVTTYYGKIVALRGVDIDVNQGEIVTQPGHGRFVRRSLGARAAVASKSSTVWPSWRGCLPRWFRATGCRLLWCFRCRSARSAS